jgi:hypothetical protein
MKTRTCAKEIDNRSAVRSGGGRGGPVGPHAGARAMKRWEPQVELSKRETVIMRRVEKKRRLFGFLRRQRLIIFDEGFQAELEGMYREAGGKAPVPPAVMALAMLLQGYLGLSDSDVVEEAYFDPR